MRSILLLALALVSSALCGCNKAPEQTEATSQTAKMSSEATEPPLFVEPDAGKTWNIFGLQIVGKVMSEQTNGKYAVVLSHTPPAGGPPLHVHANEDEMFFVLEGEYEFQCGDRKEKVSKGALVHLPRMLPHGFRNVGDKPGLLLNTITPGGFEQFFEEIDQLPKDQPLDRQEVQRIGAKYGLQFFQQ